MHLSEADLQLYRRDGLLKKEGLFSPDEAEQVQSEIQALVRQVVQSPDPRVGLVYEEDGATLRSVMGWHHGGPLLRGFAFDQRVLVPVEQILKGPVEPHQTKVQPKEPEHGGAWAPHRGDTFWRRFDGLEDPEKVMTVFIALTDQTEHNGAVRAWLGSHHISAEEADEALDRTRQDLAGDTSEYLSLQFKSSFMDRLHRNHPQRLLLGPAGTAWFCHSGLVHDSQRNDNSRVRSLAANVFRRQGLALHSTRPSYLCEPPIQA